MTTATEVVSADELESIHDASLQVLEEIGMDFLEPESRELLVAAVATVDPGTQRVHFDRAFVRSAVVDMLGDDPRIEKRDAICARNPPG